MTDPDFTEFNGVIVKFIPDDSIAKGALQIGQYADNLGRRMAYYEVRHHPHMDEMERVAMLRKVKEVVR
jgi:hypothetical protein